MISFLEKLFTSIVVSISVLFGVQATNPEVASPISTTTQEALPSIPTPKSSSIKSQGPSEDMMILDKNGEKTYFYKDSTHVWISGELPPDPFLIPGADPKTFEPLGWPYSKDAHNVYIWDSPIQSADTATFRVINRGDFSNYGVDQYHVFSGHKIIEGADPTTFTYDSTTDTAKDKNQEYHLDPDAFYK